MVVQGSSEDGLIGLDGAADGRTGLDRGIDIVWLRSETASWCRVGSYSVGVILSKFLELLLALTHQPIQPLLLGLGGGLVPRGTA